MKIERKILTLVVGILVLASIALLFNFKTTNNKDTTWRKELNSYLPREKNQEPEGWCDRSITKIRTSSEPETLSGSVEFSNGGDSLTYTDVTNHFSIEIPTEKWEVREPIVECDNSYINFFIKNINSTNPDLAWLAITIYPLIKGNGEDSYNFYVERQEIEPQDTTLAGYDALLLDNVSDDSEYGLTEGRLYKLFNDTIYKAETGIVINTFDRTSHEEYDFTIHIDSVLSTLKVL